MDHYSPVRAIVRVRFRVEQWIIKVQGRIVDHYSTGRIRVRVTIGIMLRVVRLGLGALLGV